MKYHPPHGMDPITFKEWLVAFAVLAVCGAGSIAMIYFVYAWVVK